jgi:hypothetical protein
MGTEVIANLCKARLRCLHLQLALAHVVQVLRRPDDHVHDRPDEREQRCSCGAADQHRISDAPARVGIRPVNERQPDHHQEQQQQIHDQVDRAVLDPKDA